MTSARTCRLHPALGLALAFLVSGQPGHAAGEPADEPRGLFDVYADNRSRGLPNYITEDLLLVSYSLIRQQETKKTEDEQIIPLFGQMVTGLQTALPDDEAETTEANRRFLAVIGALLEGSATALDELASAEFELVMNAGGAEVSPLWGQNLDYSQFKPRGRYAGEPLLERYFRAMRYASTALFAVQPSASTGVTQDGAERNAAQAFQLASLMKEEPLKSKRAYLDQLLGWRVGPADDLTDADVLAAVSARADKTSVADTIAAYAKEQGKLPRILGMIVDETRLEPGLTPQDVAIGWRLFPQRYTADSAAFQRLVYDGTGVFEGEVSTGNPPFGLSLINGQPVKGYPLGAELLALLGSDKARAALDAAGETRFSGYGQAFEDARLLLTNAQGLRGAQFGFMSTVLNTCADKAQRCHNSLLGFWTWQRYLDLLYTKQSYTLSAKSFEADPARPGATIEPAVQLFQALGGLVEAHLRASGSPRWRLFDGLLDQVIVLAAEVKNGRKLTADQETFLNGLDKALLALTGGRDLPIIVDVHTNAAEGKVLEEGISFPSVVSQGSARGALLSHHEFKQPMADRLTDEQWRARLNEAKEKQTVNWQEKLDADLLAIAEAARGSKPMPKSLLESVQAKGGMGKAGNVSVRIIATKEDRVPDLRARVESLSAVVTTVFKNTLFAEVPVTAVEPIAREEDVWTLSLNMRVASPQ